MPPSILNQIPTWILMLMVALLVVGLGEAGFRIGRLRAAADAGSDPSELVQAAAFTLAALLLAFAFSLALERFDARRGVLVAEANSLGTTFLRTNLLDPVTARAMRDDLRRYVALRIDYAMADADASRRSRDAERSEKVSDAMWSLAMRAANHDPHSTTVPLFIATLNETIDLSTSQSAILQAHIPDVVMAGLILIVAIASGLMGYGFGRKRQRAFIPKILYAMMLALAVGLVFDLDRPQRGFIRVSLEPLLAVQADLDRHR